MGEAMNPQRRMNAMLGQRPGLVTFAAIMMFMLGAFQLTFAILEFGHAAWVAVNVAGTFGGPLWLWGIVDTLFALIAFYAAYDIMRGGEFGRFYGLFLAVFSAIRWFFYIPASPWVAVVVIAVNVLIIYGLAAHSEYFSSAPYSRTPSP
jgi:hypothetical protein